MHFASGDKDSATPLYVQEMGECMGSGPFSMADSMTCDMKRVFVCVCVCVDLVFLIHCICHELCFYVMIHYGLFSACELATLLFALCKSSGSFTYSQRSSC